MSSINPLGRLLNAGVSATGANVRVSLRDASGVLILVPAASGAVTVQEANAATGGTVQNLPVITEYWTSNNGVWTRVAQAAAATATAATGGLLAVYVPQGALSDGFSYVTANHGTASCIFLLSDLDVQRRPTNLRDYRA